MFGRTLAAAAPKGVLLPADPSDPWVSLIVDTREHPWLPAAVRQHVGLARLPLVFVCGPGNRDFVKSKVVNDTPVCQIVELGADIQSPEDYSRLLVDPVFWDHPCFAGRSKVLVFQWDTLLRRPLRKREWAKLDYVGAPWPVKPGYPEQGGNGGLSLRSIFATKACLATVPTASPEDFYFSRAMRQMGFRVGTKEEAERFAAETIDSHDPFGLHSPWKYIDPARLLSTVV